MEKIRVFLRKIIYLVRIFLSGKSIFYVNGPELLPAPLSREEEIETIARLEFDERARQVLIEHNLPLTMKVCDRITVLSYGKKICEGSPEHVKNDKQVIEAYLGEEDKD